ncbi:MAG: copper homeostasis protein CutC [Acidobacteria bacterium]|nr:copper homeostasis protein CutC [Acidobacteriota bacterium]
MTDPILLEICADSVESALAAEQGGAHRVELCGSLLEGGITPSSGLISTVRSKIGIELYVMIRPRGGDFCYRAGEFETMEQDVRTAKKLGANGIVFGILEEDGNLDVPRTRRLIELARPLKTTFHRAFDMSRDLGKSLEDVIASGADRVLTSGGEQKVEDGITAIAKLVLGAKQRIAVMAGGGITESNVHRIVEATGVREIHAGARVHLPSPMRHRNEKVSMGTAKGREYQRVMVCPQQVRRLLENAHNGAPARHSADRASLRTQ